MNRVYFSIWLLPRLERAKKAKVKLSNKNREKLRSIWIDWCMEQSPGESVLSVLFWCAYAENIDTILNTEMGKNILRKTDSLFGISADILSGSLYSQPVILGPEYGVTWNSEE